MNVYQQRISKVLGTFSDLHVGVVGDILLDEEIRGVIERLNPEAPTRPLLKITDTQYALDGAGNVAANVASLGARVTLYGLLGATDQDFPSTSLKNQLYNKVIETEAERAGIALHVEHEGETIVKQRLREHSQHGYIARSDWGETHLAPISEENQRSILFALSRNIPLDALILSDYAKRMFTGGFSQRILQFAQQEKIPVFADPKPCNIAYYQDLTLVRPNEREARLMVRDETSDIRSIARLLHATTRCREVIITRGKEGMLGYDGQFYEIPTNVRSVADVTGAGDTTIAALALSRISGATLPEAMSLANYAAGVVVEKAGTATVTREELLERMK